MSSPASLPDTATARQETARFLAALGLYGLFYATFFSQSFLSGNLLAPSDSFDYGVADYLSPIMAWTDGMFSGFPSAADPQSFVFHPLLQACRLLGIDWNVFLISAYAITGASTFLLIRRLTGSTLAAAFGGLVCSLSAGMVAYIASFNVVQAFAWVPLVFYGLQRIREGAVRGGTALAGVAGALMWLGHPQVSVYAVYLAGFLVLGQLVVDRPPRATAIARLGWSLGAILLGILLAGCLFVPAMELTSVTARSEANWELYNSSSLPPRELLTLWMPMVFGGFWTSAAPVPPLTLGDSPYLGLLPLGLLAVAPFVVARRGEVRLWCALAGLELALAMAGATPVGTLFYYLPGLSSFQAPVRHLFLFSLSVAVVSSFAVAEIRRNARVLSATAVALAGLSVAAFLTFIPVVVSSGVFDQLSEASPDYVLWAVQWPAGVAAAFVLVALLAWRLPAGRARGVALGTLMVLHVVDLSAFHYRVPGRRFEYADTVRQDIELHPRMAELSAALARSGERMIAVDGSRNAFLMPNLTRAWGVPVAGGSASLGIRTYMELLQMGPSGAVEADTLGPDNWSLDVLAVRYALVREGSELAAALQNQADRWQPREALHYNEDDPDTHFTLFENLRSQPRAWCTPRVEAVDADQSLSALRTGRLPDGRPFRPADVALVEPGAVRPWAAGAGGGPATVERRLPRTYRIETPAPCMLVFSEVFYNWWRVSVDDEPRDLVRVNHTMMGIPLETGSHVVRLAQQPTSIWIGLALSGLGMLLTLALLAA